MSRLTQFNNKKGFFWGVENGGKGGNNNFFS